MISISRTEKSSGKEKQLRFNMEILYIAIIAFNGSYYFWQESFQSSAGWFSSAYVKTVQLRWKEEKKKATRIKARGVFRDDDGVYLIPKIPFARIHAERRQKRRFYAGPADIFLAAIKSAQNPKRAAN